MKIFQVCSTLSKYIPSRLSMIEQQNDHDQMLMLDQHVDAILVTSFGRRTMGLRRQQKTSLGRKAYAESHR